MAFRRTFLLTLLVISPIVIGISLYYFVFKHKQIKASSSFPWLSFEARSSGDLTGTNKLQVQPHTTSSIEPSEHITSSTGGSTEGETEGESEGEFTPTTRSDGQVDDELEVVSLQNEFGEDEFEEVGLELDSIPMFTPVAELSRT